MTTPQDKKLIGKLTKQGETLALSMLSADAIASATKQKALLSVASEYLDKGRYEIVINAYAETLASKGQTDNTVKVRKSELLQVIKACNHTQVTGDNLKELQSFEGHYNDLIALAREINARYKAETTPKAPKVKDKLNETELAKAVELISFASPSQLNVITGEVTHNINANLNPKIAGYQQLVLISSIANNAISNADIEAPIIECFKAVLVLAEKQILEIQQVMNATAEVMTNAAIEAEPLM